MFFIETERLKLIPLTHAQLLLLQKSRPAMETSLGLNPSNMFIDQIWQDEFDDALINWWIPKTLANPDRWIWYTLWEAVLKDTNTSVGGFGLGYPNEKGESITGYSIDGKQQGKGFGTEGLTGICKWGFENPSVAMISADTGIANLPSQRILEKAGFERGQIKEGLVAYHLTRP